MTGEKDAFSWLSEWGKGLQPEPEISTFSTSGDEGGKEYLRQHPDIADFSKISTFSTGEGNALDEEDFHAALNADPDPIGKTGARVGISYSSLGGKSGKENESSDLAFPLDDRKVEKVEKAAPAFSTEPEDLVALFEERAAIREYDGGFERPHAQSCSLDDCIDELTGWSRDADTRAAALAHLRTIGIRQPELFPDETEIPF